MIGGPGTGDMKVEVKNELDDGVPPPVGVVKLMIHCLWLVTYRQFYEIFCEWKV